MGVEFNTGQMSGLLSENAPSGVITDLWAETVFSDKKYQQTLNDPN